MKSTISILMINPWIYDFAAYNVWSEPLGILYLARLFENSGAIVNVIDCLISKQTSLPKQKPDGRSKLFRTIVKKPDVLSFVDRNYAAYGISIEEFEERLLETEKQTGPPDLIFVTSIMTYWYPGTFKVIELVKKLWKYTPVILGGIYATLCTEHARKYSGADLVFRGNSIVSLTNQVNKILKQELNLPVVKSFNDYPAPAHEKISGRNFFAILTRKGCPFSCSYCASNILNPLLEERSPAKVIEEINTFSRLLNTRNVAFYDDALLLNAEKHFIPIMEGLNNDDLEFHLPNAVHSRFINYKISNILIEKKFKTIRLGLETSLKSLQEKTGNKVTNREYLNSVESLLKAGFKKENIGTYILVGLPGQTPSDVEETIKFVYKSGASPYLSFYSPIPGTPLFKEAEKLTSLNLAEEPLLHNNTVFILKHPDFSKESIQYLKDMAKELRKSN